jgi:hypothetical protein
MPLALSYTVPRVLYAPSARRGRHGNYTVPRVFFDALSLLFSVSTLIDPKATNFCSVVERNFASAFSFLPLIADLSAFEASFQRALVHESAASCFHMTIHVSLNAFRLSQVHFIR